MVLGDKTSPILSDIFIVQRYEVMTDIFSVCLEISDTFKGSGTISSFDDELLQRPFRKYLAEYVWRILLGIESYAVTFIICSLLERINMDIEVEINKADIGAQGIVSMTDLCSKGVDNAVKIAKFTAITLNQATNLCWGFDVAWRKLYNINYLHQKLNWQSESLRRSQLILTAHLWLFEEALSTQSSFVLITPINRAAVILQLSKATQALITWKSTIQKQRNELMVLVIAITQRLKWAVGANPGLQQLMTNFGDVVNAKTDFIDKVCSIAAVALNYCTSVVQYETRRISTPEAVEEDQRFLNLVSRWEKSCTMALSCSAIVSPAEEALMELLDPEGPIDQSWLANVASLIQDMTEQINLDIMKLEKQIVTAQDELQASAYRLRTLMVSHHRIAANVRSLLKSAQRIVDENQVVVIKEYIKKYKMVLETLSELHGTVLSKDFTEDIVNGALDQIAEVKELIPSVFDNLLTFEKCLEGEKKLIMPVISQVQHQESASSRPSSPARTKAQKGKKKSCQ